MFLLSVLTFIKQYFTKSTINISGKFCLYFTRFLKLFVISQTRLALKGRLRNIIYAYYEIILVHLNSLRTDFDVHHIKRYVYRYSESLIPIGYHMSPNFYLHYPEYFTLMG